MIGANPLPQVSNKKLKTVKMEKKELIKKLADLIEKNPNCTFEIDNDVWYMMDANGNQVATSDDFSYSTDWYGHSSNYGFGITEALIEILNRKGFQIKASAV